MHQARWGRSGIAVLSALAPMVACGLEVGGETIAGGEGAAPDGAPSSSAEGGASVDGGAALDGALADGAAPADGSPDASTCNDRVLFFDGVDDHATVPKANPLDLPGSFTIEAWIRPTSKVLTQEVQIASLHDHDASLGWVLLIKERRVEVRLYGKSGANDVTYTAGNGGPAYVLADTWAHVAGTYDGATLRVYYAGTLRDEATAASNDRRDYQGALRIGRAAYAQGFYFAGYLDDLRLSRIARYAGATAPKPTGPLPFDADTVALYRFDETSGDSILDSSGGGHTGTFAAGAAPARVLAPCASAR